MDVSPRPSGAAARAWVHEHGPRETLHCPVFMDPGPARSALRQGRQSRMTGVLERSGFTAVGITPPHPGPPPRGGGGMRFRAPSSSMVEGGGGSGLDGSRKRRRNFCITASCLFLPASPTRRPHNRHASGTCRGRRHGRTSTTPKRSMAPDCGGRAARKASAARAMRWRGVTASASRLGRALTSTKAVTRPRRTIRPTAPAWTRKPRASTRQPASVSHSAGPRLWRAGRVARRSGGRPAPPQSPSSRARARA